ncbi:MAG: hypothetical protein HAW67_03995 [Endozoicomonadaceae bacterium]|nr:hypothetical protein [Endozoicomonadaceae bacterium]
MTDNDDNYIHLYALTLCNGELVLKDIIFPELIFTNHRKDALLLALETVKYLQNLYSGKFALEYEKKKSIKVSENSSEAVNDG